MDKVLICFYYKRMWVLVDNKHIFGKVKWRITFPINATFKIKNRLQCYQYESIRFALNSKYIAISYPYTTTVNENILLASLVFYYFNFLLKFICHWLIWPTSYVRLRFGNSCGCHNSSYRIFHSRRGQHIMCVLMLQQQQRTKCGWNKYMKTKFCIEQN